MLNELLVWWGGRLQSLLPHGLRGVGAGRPAVRLLLELGLDRVRVEGGRGAAGARGYALDADGLVAVRAAAGGRGVVELGLPPGRVLVQEVVLPLAAERDPGRVLRYEMDRVTPFAANDLHWTWEVLRRDRAAGTVRVRLLLVPRAPLRPVLEALAGAGLRPGVLRAGTDVIPLDAAAGRGRGLRFVLPGCAAALALVAAGLPFVQQSRESARIERRIAALRPAVAEAEGIRRRAQAEVADVDVLAAQRAASGSALRMLAALTAALPDDTVLTDLAYRARVATVSGASAAAVRLIPLLVAQPALVNTAFTAPVTRNDTARTEGFTLRTELAP